jgi:hypothetical protein
MARKRIQKSNDGGIEGVLEYFKRLTAIGGGTYLLLNRSKPAEKLSLVHDCP